MAIGSLISNRNFGSFIDSGQLYKREHAIECYRGERSGYAAVQYVHTKMFYKSLCVQRKSCSFFHFSGVSNGDPLRSNATFQNDGEHPLSMTLQLSKKFQSTNHRRRIRAICACYLAATPCYRNQLRKLDKLGINNRRHHLSKHLTVNMTRADYRSEDSDIGGSGVDSFLSSEGPSDVVIGKDEQAKPWWEQFPKRWVIVLLCFAAFLLCNMDRVNMSIAILPMAQEFNWNSATVGLIQSSFFWGYLLTQIVGGIWADKIGGKRVLGFGVVWWSVATVLTPIAAKIGLPFLLIMRAFMGIGEVGLLLCFFVALQRLTRFWFSHLDASLWLFNGLPGYSLVI